MIFGIIGFFTAGCIYLYGLLRIILNLPVDVFTTLYVKIYTIGICLYISNVIIKTLQKLVYVLFWMGVLLLTLDILASRRYFNIKLFRFILTRFRLFKLYVLKTRVGTQIVRYILY